MSPIKSSFLEKSPKQSRHRLHRAITFMAAALAFGMNCYADNPIIQTKYTADPAPMVYNDTVFLYTGHDEDYAFGFAMFNWMLYTSTDMVNWTEQGIIAGVKEPYKTFAWADGHSAWAPQCVARNGKFYFYCPTIHQGKMAIGVAVADSPYGPFVDAIGKPLIFRSNPGDYDPTVFTDDDGQAYIYWGGNGPCYYAKLNEDMISLDGEINIASIDFTGTPPEASFTEGPWIWKRNSHYYLAWASRCCPEGIGYAMSDSPTGPWKCKGTIMDPDGRSNGNHPGIINYKGNSYVFGLNYGILKQTMSKHYERRSVCVEQMTYNEDGTIQKLPWWTVTGPPQIGTFNPYNKIEAETMAYSEGVKTEFATEWERNISWDKGEKIADRLFVTSIQDGDYIKVKGVNFSEGVASVEVSVASLYGGKIEIRSDKIDGPLLGTVNVTNRGEGDLWRTVNAPVSNIKGVHDLFFVFRGDKDLFNFDWWKMSPKQVVEADNAKLAGNSDITGGQLFEAANPKLDRANSQGNQLFGAEQPKLVGNSTSPGKQLFDYDWKFFLGDTASARLNEFDDKTWRSLDLPHDWSIEGQIHPKNITGMAGGYFPAGVGWYRKTFKAPGEWKDKIVSIYFEGVYMNSEVFINGKSLGVYPYGYSSFSYDLTPYLEIEKENVIAVRVDNSQQVNSRWYSGSGIYRHVWMKVANPIHVAHWGVGISTPAVTSKKATVQVKTLVKNETALPQSVVVRTRIFDIDNKGAGEKQTKADIEANSQKEITQTISVSNPLLWSPETPNMYQALIQVNNDNQVVDDTKTNFGIRSLKFSAENGFQLNGKPVLLNGGCVHHDNGCLGAAAFDRAEERRVELLKAAGFNAVRTSHNPPSETFLDACDRLGLLVIDEAFDGWREAKNKYDYGMYFDQWWQRDLEAMVLRDRNHPSVFMWSIGNEVYERKKPEAVEIVKMMVAAIKKTDPDRPVTSAMTTWDADWEIFDPLMAEHDVCGYNYQLHRASADHQRVPSRIILHTESYPRDAFENWELVSDNPYIIGDFVWTALDYLGESSIGRWYYSGEVPGEHWENDFFPWHGAYCGDIDLIGWRKPISHYRSMLYNNDQKLYMAVREPEPLPLAIKETQWSVWPAWESWTWPGFEGRDVQVEVYSKYPKVRLYLNNKLVGEQETTRGQKFKATFSVPYAPGSLKAVGVENDREIETTILQTSGEAAIIKLTADRKDISADGQDLSFVTIEMTDKDGITQPNATNQLHFKIEGPGSIAGVDNADIKDTDSYAGNTRKAWKGRALVVIRSNHDAGDITLTVTSPGLADATLNIKTQ